MHHCASEKEKEINGKVWNWTLSVWLDQPCQHLARWLTQITGSISIWINEFHEAWVFHNGTFCGPSSLHTLNDDFLQQMNNLNTYITRVFYASLPDNQVQAIFWVNVDQDGESFAQGQTVSAK